MRETYKEIGFDMNVLCSRAGSDLGEAVPKQLTFQILHDSDEIGQEGMRREHMEDKTDVRTSDEM